MTEKHLNLNAEGCSIRCKLYYDDLSQVRTAVLFGHGFGGHKDNRAAERFARRMLEKNKGCVLMSFNWPCHGDDVRKLLRLEDCDRYLRLAVAWLRERFPEAALYAYATSFGGYLFLKYLSEQENPFRRIALRCPAVNMFQVLSGVIMSEEDRKRLARGKPIQAGFDRKVEIDAALLESLRQADIQQRDFLPLAEDILILQGTKDEVVPPAAVEAFADRNLIEYVPVEGADHRFQDPAKMDFAIARILDFFGLR